MANWTGVVLALSPAGSDEMASRLMTCLHPVAGRPLIWHTVAGLAAIQPAPERVVIVSDVEMSPDIFQGLPIKIELLVVSDEELASMDQHLPAHSATRALVVQANAPILPGPLQALSDAPDGHWLAADDGSAAAASVEISLLPQLFRLPKPLSPPNGVLAASGRMSGVPAVLIVRNRVQLAEVVRRIRDRTVEALMLSGVSFIHPETVSVDVDVRIGRDTVVYPGVVLEGQTTVGEETVIGPGCRVIDSWIGSGVEMKGWNYVSHASVRNRAILEPYVRRGFD